MNDLTPQPISVAPPPETDSMFKPKLGKAYIIPTSEPGAAQPTYRRVQLPSSKYRPHIGEKQVLKRAARDI